MIEGLSAIISCSGTRTAYILESNQDKSNPTKIDYDDCTLYSLDYRNYLTHLDVKKAHEHYKKLATKNTIVGLLPK